MTMNIMQYYTENQARGSPDNKNSGIETRKFFINCLCLLLGRFEGKKFENIVSEYRMQLVHCLLSQLRCEDVDVMEGAVSIFKAVIFKPNPSSEGSFTYSKQMDAVLPSLLHLLDERDGTARAVVMLIAEYCSISLDNHCLREVLKCLASGNVVQRKNAIDVISEIIHITKDSAFLPSHIPWKEITSCLLEHLGDEETAICERTSDLLKLIEPSLVLPALVTLVYSSDGKLQSSATDALLGVLKHHKEDSDVICMFVDCLSKTEVVATPRTTGLSGEGSKFDVDPVLRLIPVWAKSVQNWNSLVGPLIDKLFAEPSNATIVRFLSCISEHLADAADVVLHRVLSQMKGQKGMDESFNSRSDAKSYIADNAKEKSLFNRLCPLLILRLLPMRVFSGLNSLTMYGQLLSEARDDKVVNIMNNECISSFLLKRAFSELEFEDVRKLSAELCGRIHPQVLFPIVCSHLEESAGSQDILKMKACLFALCTSLVARGTESISRLATFKIREVLERILLWPSSDGDEISKAQHGCIDCLALLICAEMEAIGSSEVSSRVEEKKEKSGVAASRNSVLKYVIQHLVHDKSELFSTSKSDSDCPVVETHVPVSFRLCMANVLISTCQKISDSGKKRLACKTLPSLIHSVEAIPQAEVRAACVQVLFSAVYHLKSALLPYSSDLLKLSLRFLENGTEKEKLAGAKLMASLMASEEVVVESIAAGLLEARLVLAKVSLTDPSTNVREVSGKLLACLTSS